MNVLATSEIKGQLVRGARSHPNLIGCEVMVVVHG